MISLPVPSIGTGFVLTTNKEINMDISPNTDNEKKISDTANTVQVSDCNPQPCASRIETVDKLLPPLLTLIDVLARQAAREICDTKDGG
jgi:hypothetical protein